MDHKAVSPVVSKLFSIILLASLLLSSFNATEASTVHAQEAASETAPLHEALLPAQSILGPSAPAALYIAKAKAVSATVGRVFDAIEGVLGTGGVETTPAEARATYLLPPDTTITGPSPTPPPGDVSGQACTPSPSTGFLYLPFDTNYSGQDNDWLRRMTATFDHHYPDYTCSTGQKTARCREKGMKLVLWEGEEARPLNAANDDPANPGTYDDNICFGSRCFGISAYQGVTGEAYFYYDGHDGYDWGLYGGSVPIVAASSGIVTSVADEGAYGWTVTIDHLNGYVTKYSHLVPGTGNPAKNTCVATGDLIGIQGSSSTKKVGIHLHFRVYHDGKITDPFGWCYFCSGTPPDPLADFNGETSQNLWYGMNPRSLGRAPTRANISLYVADYRSQYLGGPGEFYRDDDIASPGPTSTSDRAAFVADVSIPDGAVVSAGQSLTKTWRMKNTGTSTWGSGYQLAFVSGQQMGAPAAVDVPSTAPGQEANITVNLTAPSQFSDHAGYWRLRHGTTYFGDTVWIKVTVQSGATPTPPPGGGGLDVSVTNVEYPSVVAPGQSFRPKVTVRVNQGQLLQSRGDLLRNTDGQLYGAWPHVAVAGTVNAGQTYVFEFYANDPITAPSGEGTYESRWQVWANGNWVGAEITIRFDVRAGGGTRPAAPVISSPGNWSVFAESSPPALCVNAVAGAQYFFQIYDSHDIPESGWIGSNCWTPGGLGPYTYKWHAKARDNSTGLESDWSADSNFSLYSTQLSMADLEFSPGSPSSSEAVRVYTCVSGFGEIGLGLKIEANTATDGSANGDWYWIHHLGTFCYDHSNTGTWPTWGTLPLEDGDHLVRAVGYGPQGQTMVKTAVYHLERRRPNGPTLVNPSSEAWLNQRSIDFTWQSAWRTNQYRLVVGTNPDPVVAPLLDVPLGAGTTNYPYDLSVAYPDVYWRVFATNEIGSSDTIGHFHIDQDAPGSSVDSFSPPVSYETAFLVSWNGSDAGSGLRWYDIQYRDGGRPADTWVDWLTNVSEVSAIFMGQAGHTYYFRSRALDNAGNLEGWLAGDGDTAVTVDLSAKPPTPWWNAGYGYKRSLLVANNDASALPVGYPIHLHFDGATSPSASELYAASQSAVKGDDFRIVQNDTTELARYVQAFGSGQIDIWFNLKTTIAPSPGSDPTSYQLYYGNASASNPPAEVNMVLPPPSEANTLGLWHFHDGAGTTFTDTSGAGKSGTLYNGGWTAGLFGSAASFNGSSTYAEIADPTNRFDLRSFTIEGWFKLSGNGTQLLLRRRMTTGTEEAYRLEIRDWKFVGNIRGAFNTPSHTQLVQGRWYHLAFAYDGSTARTYVNGVLEGSTSFGDGTPASMGPVILGRNSANSDYMNGQVQGLRISNVSLSSFPYAAFANILSAPSSAAGSAVAQTPPVTGSPDLAVLSLATYPNPGGGVLVEAVVQNQGDADTRNGFYTDVYVNHLPTGTGDYTGSLEFWVNDPIGVGETVTLRTVITDMGALGISAADLLAPQGGIAPYTETTATLYAQTDSAGSISEPDDANNIYSAGTELCVASEDIYEDDNQYSGATSILVGILQTHNLDAAGDGDWVKFDATSGQTYLITTSGLGIAADTYLYLYDTDGQTLLTSNDDFGNSLASRIMWTAPSTGTYYVLVNHWSPNAGGCGTPYTININPRRPKADFDGDNKSDLSYFHAASGLWGVLKSGQNFSYANPQFLTWGQTGDIVVPGDFDGDGLLDPTVRRPPGGGQSAAYLILKSSTNYNYGASLIVPAGWPGLGDTPVPGDYNGDGRTDPAIWRGNSGAWIIPMSPSFNTYQFYSWGATGDTPVGADVDGDGKADIGYWRPSTGVWGFLQSSMGYSYASPLFFSWGTTGDIPVMADYDGDGKADPAVVIPPAGGQSRAYRILRSSTGYDFGQTWTMPAGWPGLGDTPVPLDFDGDGKADAGIWRGNTGVWIIPKSSTNNTTYMFAAWGASGDQVVK